MKLAISYFYQIRNFKKNMIPASTAISDPTWYHEFQDNAHIFTDKRGILNGLRLKPICNAGIACSGMCHGKDSCMTTAPNQCQFLKSYREELEKIDFEKMMNGIYALTDRYKEINKLEEEPILVLMVYETPNNPCSERGVLIDYFNSKGIECKELDYPIQNSNIKVGTFNF